MKPALVVLLGLLAASPVGAQAGNPTSDPAKPTVCSVSGLVVKLAGSAPLPSSTIRLQSVDDHTRTFSGVTDLGGRFEVKGIEPGRYRLRVIRNRYITQEYGQRTPNDPGAILALSPGQNLKDLLFRLLPSAVISGRVQNENGDFMPWIVVSALRATYVRGKRTLSREMAVITNDLGEYRLFGLRPGRYFVSAVYKPGQRDLSEEDEEAADKSGYAPTYYPSTSDPARAAAVTIEPGDEIPSTDIMLERTTAYSIRGHVNNFVSRRNGNSGNSVILVLETRSSGLGWSIPGRQTVVDKPDGAFEIENVLPGSYTLSAFLYDEGRRYQARQSIDITNIDAEGIQLTPSTGMDIRGQVIWDPKPSLERDALSLNVRPADSTLQFGAQARAAAANGTFLLRDVSEGLYRLTTSGQSQDCYLKSIRYAGMEVSDDEFNVIRGTQATLEVTISSRGAHVQGTVKDTDGLPAVGVWVVLVPNDARRNEFRLFKPRATDQFGRFDIRGIAPGDYKLFSWEQVEQNAWEDPDFLKPFEAKGESVSLQEGDSKSIDLVAIRSASHEQEKQ
jgi:hypothetical protein